jgi:hypothetical protein
MSMPRSLKTRYRDYHWWYITDFCPFFQKIRPLNHSVAQNPWIQSRLNSFIFKQGLVFTFLCSIGSGKLSKLQATKGNYDRGSHIKRLFE